MKTAPTPRGQPFPPGHSRLAPGRYIAQLSGVGNTTGVGLIEIYEVP